MADDELKGQAKQGIGQIKETAGRALGDEDTEAEGKAEQGEGKVQEGFGKVKEGVKDTFGR
jgi:uncharacterized protein YjbJ (UPF0337 family)